ncbi:hypothetical protein Tco_0609706 [Tanacetum coccineum]
MRNPAKRFHQRHPSHPAGDSAAWLESLPPGRRLCRPALGAHIFHFTLEETWKAKKDLGPLNRLWTPL